jgi:UDP-2,4-diacetamido-2,4,6-trideoxy-beta-L-altropyranose hydrolase
MKKIIFRADGNAQMGLGHLYRCCALAEIAGSQYHCVLVARYAEHFKENGISAYFNEVVFLEDGMSALEEVNSINAIEGNKLLILDGYHFDTQYQKQLKQELGCRIICVDDIHNYHFVADAVINHAGGIRASDYSLDPATRLFLGPQYAIIRKEFRQEPTVAPEQGNILMTYGGSDPVNKTTDTLRRMLERYGAAYQIHVVVGPANRYYNEILSVAENQACVTVYRNINAQQMLELMQRAFVCIASPSSVSLEYLTTTNSYLVSDLIADNQQVFYQYLLKNKLSVSLDQFLESDRNALSQINLQAVQHIFDRKSGTRLLEIINTFI